MKFKEKSPPRKFLVGTHNKFYINDCGSVYLEDDEQITFYHNIGNQGLQFSSVGGLVYEKALKGKVGRQFPTEWFLQDIRD